MDTCFSSLKDFSGSLVSESHKELFTLLSQAEEHSSSRTYRADVKDALQRAWPPASSYPCSVGHLPVQELGRNDRLVVLEESDIWLFSQGVPGTFLGGTTVFTVERS